MSLLELEVVAREVLVITESDAMEVSLAEAEVDDKLVPLMLVDVSELLLEELEALFVLVAAVALEVTDASLVEAVEEIALFVLVVTVALEVA